MADPKPNARRDRDELGRARNARPRDALGRPLPYGSPNVERLPEGIRRTPAEVIDEAQRLLDAGLPFHTHEIFEDAWKFANGADRELWKGLAQLAVGLTHIARGNRAGASKLFARGISAIEPYADTPPYQMDVAGILIWSGDVADRVAQWVAVQPLEIAPPRLRSS